jgi:cellulose synthase/poly-beta-1,6-N-acetylglucosamine synthase-like glycosyltransferase
MQRLNRSSCALPVPPPNVTVLVPAKDEGEGVRDSLQSVLALDYPSFDVLAVDDRSTDQTGAIMDELAAAHPHRLNALHIPADGLPPGWLGKCNALHIAAGRAKGQWLLFVDSDVKVQPHALTMVLRQAAARDYDAVSIMTRLDCDGFWDALLLPLCAASVGWIGLMSVTNNDSRRKNAFANGQFFLIRRSAYERVGGHAAVRDNITEDVALMRVLKAAGFRTRLYNGQSLASTRMHTTWRQLFNGWARIFSGVTERRAGRILAAMAFVGLSGLSAYVALAYGLFRAVRADDWSWLSLAAFHVVLMTAVLATIYQLSGNARRLALAFPVGGAVMLGIYAYAVRACRTGRIAWRGTHYTAAAGSAASPSPPPAAPKGPDVVPDAPSHGAPAART